MAIKELSDKLFVPEEWLLRLFRIESGNNPRAVNKTTGATGLIQFMPATARRLGTTCAALKCMDYDAQLDYVYKYLCPYARRFMQFSDLYFAVFFPAAIGKPDDYVLKSSSLSASKIAQQNKCYDVNKDGRLNVGEVKQIIEKFKNVAALIVAVLLLSCCGSAKITDKHDVELQDKSKVDVVQTHEEQVKTERVTIIEEYATMVMETVEVVYDTEKPLDASTGKPPVKTETVKKKTVVKGKQGQTDAVTSRTAADSTADRTRRDVNVDAEAEHEETPEKSKFAYIYYILLIVAGGAAVYFLNRKFRWIL
jgi:hypothetical protein